LPFQQMRGSVGSFYGERIDDRLDRWRFWRQETRQNNRSTAIIIGRDSVAGLGRPKISSRRRRTTTAIFLLPAGLHSCGSCSRSVIGAARKLPVRVKVELEVSKFMVTLHSLSRFCLRSKQTAKAQPTAWLSRSPCPNGKNGRHDQLMKNKRGTEILH
jgi:hypothetical protein